MTSNNETTLGSYEQAMYMSDEEIEKGIQEASMMTAENTELVQKDDIPVEVEDKYLDNTENVDNNSVIDTPVSESTSDTTTETNNTDIQEEQLDTEEQEVQVQETEGEPTKYKLKANGQMYDFTIDELTSFASKGLNYVRKMQQLKPYSKTISAIKEYGISEDDINQLIEMKKGNTDAVANFLQKNNISSYDVSMVDNDRATNYRANQYGESEQSTLKDIIDEVQLHPQYNVLQRYVSGLDEKSSQLILEKPEIIKHLMNDIENGVFNDIAPEANKRALLDDNNQSLLDHYINVANEVYTKKVNEAKAVKQQQQVSNRNVARNKARVSGNQGLPTLPDKEIHSVADITDDDFENFLKSQGILSFEYGRKNN